MLCSQAFALSFKEKGNNRRRTKSIRTFGVLINSHTSLKVLTWSYGSLFSIPLKHRRLLSELGFNSKRMALSGTIIRDGVLVASGANNYLRDLGGFHSPMFTDFSNLNSKLWESAGKFGGIVRLYLVVRSISKSKLTSSRFRDLHPSMQTEIKNYK